MNQTSSERISEYLWKTCVTRSWWVMGEADVCRTFLRSLSVLQTSSKTLGGFLEHHGGGWWKMAAFPLPVTIWDDLIFRFLWGHFPWKWPHPIWRKREMRSSQMVTGSGKAAIFHHPPPWCSKNPPNTTRCVIMKGFNQFAYSLIKSTFSRTK